MRARPPVIRVDASELVVRTDLVASDGTELAPIEVRVPVARAHLLDPTATPGVPTLVTLAVLRGEDLEIQGEVDERMAAGAREQARLLADRWGLEVPRIEVAGTYAAPLAGDGVGLIFDRGVDSWSTLLDLLALDPSDRATHLLTVHHRPPPAVRTVEAEVTAGHLSVAEELGLELVVATTNARAHLDPFRRWVDTSAAVLTATGLQVACGLRRLVLAGAHPADVPTCTASDPDLLATFGPSATEVLFGNPDRTRDERVAHLARNPFARATLHVCQEGTTAGNCGRCLECQLTLGSLLLAGDPAPADGFDHGPDADVVRDLPLRPELGAFVSGIVHDLPPEYEELRRAWSDAWDRARDVQPRDRWGDDAPPPLAGPSMAARVAGALRATTGQATAPAPAPIGWRPGTVPLRPAHDRFDEVRALVAATPERPVSWAVVEPHIRDGVRDPHQAGLARRLQEAHGRGICYLPGILWSHLDPPTLGPDAVARLLRTARARLWWRADGDLEPLRVVEAIEHGCLPLQVMPDGPAADLASALPPALATLVVAESALPRLDLSPDGVAARLGPTADHLLLGSAEHDLLAGAYS